MSLFVNTNVSALNAQRQLFDSSNSLSQSFERLSSGQRINRANQGVRNANDGISLAQTAEGALSESTSALQRIRQLAVQSQNGINSAADRNALNAEVSALVLELSRIGSDTQFNGIDILDGSFSAAFLVGSNAGQNVSVNLSRAGGFGASGLGVGTISVSTAANAETALATLDTAISALGASRADLGALSNRFESTIRNISNVSENLSSARSQITDTDFAAETANLTKNQILQQASLSILAQASQRPQSALALLG